MANPAPGFEKHPDYLVTVTPLEGTLSVKLNGTTIARSKRAVVLNETRHRPVWYMPLADIDVAFTEPTDTRTFCPFKGYASYWSVQTDEAREEDAIWAYCDPYDECLAIKDHASFYTNKLDVYIDDEPVDKAGPGWTD